MRRLLTFAAGAAVSAAALITSVPAGQAASRICQHIHGPFHTRGSAVFNRAGHRYIPYGINIVGLAHPLLMRAEYASTVASDESVIQAADDDWCANTVRLQIEQDYLIGSGGTLNKPFLHALEAEVAYAQHLGLVVALNDQTQMTPAHRVEFMPTQTTMEFWSALAPRFGRDPGVIFDLFNEPFHVKNWAQWRNGGTNLGVHFTGMQNVAGLVRRLGARNLLWIEGPRTGGSLVQAWQYRLRGVGPLMYDMHRPSAPHTPARWNALFGYLAAKNEAPVVIGEWADYARSDADWACWDDAPTTVPVFLRYLAKLRIGMIATKMTPGQLIESASMTDPTHFRRNWSCTTGLDQGAGSQIRVWFGRYNG